MIFDIFKKKKKPKKESVKLSREPKKKVSIEKPVKIKLPKIKKLNEAHQILKTPHVTEKAGDLASKNQYVFKVWPKANKLEIKKAVEESYGVDVLLVRIIKVSPKKRKLGRISGWTKGYKKAILKIKEGQKIELLPR